MIHGKHDVTPSVENAGLTVRCTRNLAELEKLPEARKGKEIAAINEGNTEATAKYLARIHDANARDLHTTTANGLPIVGPASGDAQSVMAMAHNHAMVILDAKIAVLEAKIAQLEASK